MKNIEISFLDHVAIRVADIPTSEAWYERVLGLKKVHKKEWGDFPVYMLSGKSGIALFPASVSDPILDQGSKNIKIDHFAFNVDQVNFERAKERFNEMNIDYDIQDHVHFKSIYIKDPDNHTVELTTILVDAASFYTS